MSGLRIPFVNLPRQYESLKDEILNAQNAVYSSGKMLDGEYTCKFEDAMAKRCGRKYAVAVNSCTQALVFSNMMVSKIGDEIHIPSLSFSATLNSILMTNRTPRFLDVDSQGLINLDDSDKIKVLTFVDLYGNMVDRNKLRRFSHSKLIEDAAQSFGASWNGEPAGSFGTISCLSFDPTKNLPNYGSGGMLLTDDESFYHTAKNLRDNAKFGGYMGTNSKMSESDCASMLVKLNHFDHWQQRRRKIASYYNEILERYVETPKIQSGVIPSWHKYVIQTNEQLPLVEYLNNKGVECRIHYPKPLSDTLMASKLTKRVISLPIYPELTDSEIEFVVDAVIDFFI